jgi:hypothetical protein
VLVHHGSVPCGLDLHELVSLGSDCGSLTLAIARIGVADAQILRDRMLRRVS